MKKYSVRPAAPNDIETGYDLIVTQNMESLLLHSLWILSARVQRVKLSVDTKSLTNAPHFYKNAGMNIIQRYHIYEKNLGMWYYTTTLEIDVEKTIHHKTITWARQIWVIT